MQSLNTSGQGKMASVPEGITGWSWGGFLLAPIWAIGNKTWLGLLACIPLLNLVIPIVLGLNGKKWAWQNKRWESIEEFNRVQKLWTKWGVGLTAVGGLLYLVSLMAGS
ncbi:hypothetical protein D3C72_940880 [compost metagenome]